MSLQKRTSLRLRVLNLSTDILQEKTKLSVSLPKRSRVTDGGVTDDRFVVDEVDGGCS